MVTKKDGRRQPGIREFRSAVAKLKDKGLVSKRVDARSQKPTRYMREQVRKFSDVLEGRAAVIHTPKRSQAVALEDVFKRKGKAVVVPKEKGERIHYSPTTGKITGTRTAYGRKVTKEFVTRKVESAKDLPTGSGIIYTIPLGASLRSFDNIADLENFMFPYAMAARNPYKSWERYVLIERAAR